MMTLRIAILGHFPVDEPPTGGVQSVIANLRDELARRPNIDLHLIQNRRGAPVGTFQRQGWIEHNLAAKETRIIPNMMRTPGLLRPLLKELAPDVVSSHQPEYAAVALKMGLPVLHTIHGFPTDEFWIRRGLFTRTAILWEAWQERQLLRRARHLVAISDMIVARYGNRTQAQFHRINNPVSSLFFAPAPEPTPGHLLMVGNLTPIKGIEIAIQTVQRLLPRFPHLRLTIVGKNADSVYAEKMRALAEPLHEAIRFAGPMPQISVKKLLDDSQALLVTSNQEHAPMIIGEAMAAGRPVVATQVGAVAGMITPGESGYLAAAGDVAAVAAGLTRLLSDPEHAAQMGANAARFAREHYHPDAVADAYLRAMHAAMAG